MRYVGMLLLWLSLAVAGPAAVRDGFNGCYQRGMAAYQAKDYDTCIREFERALGFIPSHPTVTYNLACAYALKGDVGAAVKWLERAVAYGMAVDVQSDQDFDSIRQSAAFRRVVTRLEATRRPVARGSVAFTLPEKDLIPEGIAWDSTTGDFYLGSIYKAKIVRVSRDGRIADFTAPRQDGLRSVIGMKVDARRRVLWACSAVNSPRAAGFDPAELGWSGLFKYDLVTGRLLAKYDLPPRDGKHLLNDLVVTEAGDVYVSDSEAGSVWQVTADSGLQLLVHSDDFLYPNGITLSADGRALYLANSSSGVVRIDLATRRVTPVTAPAGISPIGIDGMYLYRGGLVVVQGIFGRITRLILDPSGQRIVSAEILEARNPHFDTPTTGAPADGFLYLIANSQLQRFDADNRLLPLDQLRDVTVLKIPMSGGVLVESVGESPAAGQ